MSDQEPKPQKINRMDPLWGMFAAAAVPLSTGHIEDRAKWCADFADAMLRERGRRDREEQ